MARFIISPNLKSEELAASQLTDEQVAHRLNTEPFVDGVLLRELVRRPNLAHSWNADKGCYWTATLDWWREYNQKSRKSAFTQKLEQIMTQEADV